MRNSSATPPLVEVFSSNVENLFVLLLLEMSRKSCGVVCYDSRRGGPLVALYVVRGHAVWHRGPEVER